MKIEQFPQEVSAAVGQAEDALSGRLRFWRRSLEKHRWAIMLLTLLVGAVTTLVVYSMAPIYRATAALYIEPAKSKVISIEEVYSGIGGMSGNREHIQTQVEILKSRELAGKLVKRLNLTTAP